MQFVLKQAQYYLISTPDTVVIVHLYYIIATAPTPQSSHLSSCFTHRHRYIKTCYLIFLKRNIAYICNLNTIF